MRPSERRPVAVELFSGAGGMSLGFEQAGFDVLAAVEYDPVHAATHSFNFPLTEMLCRDVRRIDADDVRAAAARGWRRHRPGGPAWDGQLDAIFGGPSCQGFSIIGGRDELDERNLLLEEFVRLVISLRPKSFCVENVPGLLEPRFAKLRDRAFGQLFDAGYEFVLPKKPLNAADFGVPQNRKRVLILGVMQGPPPSPPMASEEVVTVAQALDGLPSPCRYPALLHDDQVVLRKNDQRRREKSVSVYARQMSGLDPEPLDLSRPRQWLATLLTNSRLTVHQDDTVLRFGSTPGGGVEETSRAYRLHPESPARTLRAGTGRERGAFSAPRPIHPLEPRVITVREAARLHSFPDWFRLHTTNWHGHRQIGNAVPPRLARAAARSILDALNFAPRRARRALDLGESSLLRLSLREAMETVTAKQDEIPATRTRRCPDEAPTRVV
jgi:DNA (cytosine-5)-methyltransferase 1